MSYLLSCEVAYLPFVTLPAFDFAFSPAWPQEKDGVVYSVRQPAFAMVFRACKTQA